MSSARSSPSLSSLSMSFLNQGFAQTKDLEWSTSSILEFQLNSKGSQASSSEVVADLLDLTPAERSLTLGFSPAQLLPHVEVLSSLKAEGNVPLEIIRDSKSSTPRPNGFPQMASLETPADLSCVDLSDLPSTAQPLWEVSAIRHGGSLMESSPLDLHNTGEDDFWSSGPKSITFAEGLLYSSNVQPPGSGGGLFIHSDQLLLPLHRESGLGSRIHQFTFPGPNVDQRFQGSGLSPAAEYISGPVNRNS
ncbi:uncharacterized protein LOC114659551 [Erpetoichthys calabaricus]|uniref:uncharacterized protein LOC114659551 n=1 Tax=Erpetoichthys calabaricus TaxID=27687 RepID=UPI00109F6F63|nr:uncharacterized protein LOC114659551 [Erpetoichthys calabaricus]XP_028667940.1 uncharacterized protein LOC114659551 [Erpetoichthys calabaricus]